MSSSTENTNIQERSRIEWEEHVFEVADKNSWLGTGKLSTVLACLKRVPDIPGSVAELGVYKGGTAYLIASLAMERPCFLFDTFEGIPLKGENDVHNIGDFSDITLESVKALLSHCDNVQFRVGVFPDTALDLDKERYIFVHIDADQYQTTVDALEYFYPRMNDGGIMLFDDYEWENCPGVAKALHEFLEDKPEKLELPYAHQAIVTKECSAS